MKRLWCIVLFVMAMSSCKEDIVYYADIESLSWGEDIIINDTDKNVCLFLRNDEQDEEISMNIEPQGSVRLDIPSRKWFLCVQTCDILTISFPDGRKYDSAYNDIFLRNYEYEEREYYAEENVLSSRPWPIYTYHINSDIYSASLE